MDGVVFPPCYLPVANYGRGNEDNGDLLQKIPCMYYFTQCPQPCSSPQPTHASAGDSWTLTGKSGRVSCWVPAPISWVLLHTRFACALQESVSPVLCKFCWLYDGVNGDLLQEAYATLRSAAPRAPAPAAGHCWQVPSQETVKHSSVSVSVGSLGPGVHKVYFSLLSISGRCGVWF